MPGTQNPGAVGLLYSGKHQSGDALVCGSTDIGPRYDRWWSTDLYAAGALDNVRSVSVFAADAGAAVMLLFSNYNSWGCDFGGDFQQFTNTHRHLQFDDDIPQSFYYNPAWGDFTMVYSMLMVQTQRRPELRVSYRDALIPQWNSFGAKQLPKQVSFDGPPQLTWMPFPKQEEYLSPDQIYLYIYQPIIIDFSDYWANYHANFEFWLRLSVSDGKVKSHVQRWGYWIEGGAFTSVVEQILKPNLELAIPHLESGVDQALAMVPSGVTGVYYLPGKQLTAQADNKNIRSEGNVEHDVTIIFEF